MRILNEYIGCVCLTCSVCWTCMSIVGVYVCELECAYVCVECTYVTKHTLVASFLVLFLLTFATSSSFSSSSSSSPFFLFPPFPTFLRSSFDLVPPYSNKLVCLEWNSIHADSVAITCAYLSWGLHGSFLLLLLEVIVFDQALVDP